MKKIMVIAYGLFIVFSFAYGFTPGKEMAVNFADFFTFMLKLIPGVFILLGLFEVWVKRETIEKHLGGGSGIKGYLWAILLGSTAAGGLYVAFPIADSLYRKGAGIRIIFTYIGAAAICRIPMTAFEAGFMGVKFTAVRLAVSIPLVVLSSIILERYLTKYGYELTYMNMKRENL